VAVVEHFNLAQLVYQVALAVVVLGLLVLVVQELLGKDLLGVLVQQA
jgi:hypothetical protein